MTDRKGARRHMKCICVCFAEFVHWCNWQNLETHLGSGGVLYSINFLFNVFQAVLLVSLLYMLLHLLPYIALFLLYNLLSLTTQFWLATRYSLTQTLREFFRSVVACSDGEIPWKRIPYIVFCSRVCEIVLR